jgi:LysR family transcriptional activator of nhaA
MSDDKSWTTTPARHLNYNHLLYFWTVAREGSIAKASEFLHLTPQTISGQIKQLEASIGKALFRRVGRSLVLTDTGHAVMPYAEEIFSLGGELAQRVRSEDHDRPTVLNVGIVNSIPKLIAFRTLEPAMSMQAPVRMVCWGGELDSMLADLAVHRLDLVLSDRPVPSGMNVKAYSHLLGESGISFFAHKGIARQYTRDFPRSLDRAPMLLPVTTGALRRSLDDWFASHNVVPQILAEFDDSALMKAFSEAGNSLFAAPEAIADEIEHTYEARRIASADGLHERYYAISAERKLKHPAVLEITERARNTLFG